MLKKRDGLYCNCKLLLMFFVVYGHLIEGAALRSSLFAVQYRCIYLFHMPLFVFLTGLFLKTPRQCARQGWRMLAWYLALQGPLVLLDPQRYSLSLPWWHLWYLLSLAQWCCIGWLYYRFGRDLWYGKLILLMLAVAAAVLCGNFPQIGRKWSWSRTVVLLPFFLAGLFCPTTVSWHRMKTGGILGLLVGILAYIQLKATPVYFLYHAAPYQSYGAMAGRLWALAGGAGLGLFVLTFCPKRRFPWTKAGCDTLPTYLLHAPVVKFYLRRLPLSPINAPLLAAGLLLFIFTLFRWWGPMCAIPSGKEDASCGRSNKSTSTMLSRSIGSSWP